MDTTTTTPAIQYATDPARQTRLLYAGQQCFTPGLTARTEVRDSTEKGYFVAIVDVFDDRVSKDTERAPDAAARRTRCASRREADAFVSSMMRALVASMGGEL